MDFTLNRNKLQVHRILDLVVNILKDLFTQYFEFH